MTLEFWQCSWSPYWRNADPKACTQDDAQATDAAPKGEQVKKGYVGIHSTGFKDFLLKPELMRAIVDCGFEHPSEGERPRNQTSWCRLCD